MTSHCSKQSSRDEQQQYPDPCAAACDTTRKDLVEIFTKLLLQTTNILNAGESKMLHGILEPLVNSILDTRDGETGDAHKIGCSFSRQPTSGATQSEFRRIQTEMEVLNIQNRIKEIATRVDDLTRALSGNLLASRYIFKLRHQPDKTCCSSSGKVVSPARSVSIETGERICGTSIRGPNDKWYTDDAYMTAVPPSDNEPISEERHGVKNEARAESSKSYHNDDLGQGEGIHIHEIKVSDVKSDSPGRQPAAEHNGNHHAERLTAGSEHRPLRRTILPIARHERIPKDLDENPELIDYTITPLPNHFVILEPTDKISRLTFHNPATVYSFPAEAKPAWIIPVLQCDISDRARHGQRFRVHQVKGGLEYLRLETAMNQRWIAEKADPARLGYSYLFPQGSRKTFIISDDKVEIELKESHMRDGKDSGPHDSAHSKDSIPEDTIQRNVRENVDPEIEKFLRQVEKLNRNGPLAGNPSAWMQLAKSLSLHNGSLRRDIAKYQERLESAEEDVIWHVRTLSTLEDQLLVASRENTRLEEELEYLRAMRSDPASPTQYSFPVNYTPHTTSRCDSAASSNMFAYPKFTRECSLSCPASEPLSSFVFHPQTSKIVFPDHDTHQYVFPRGSTLQGILEILIRRRAQGLNEDTYLEHVREILEQRRALGSDLSYRVESGEMVVRSACVCGARDSRSVSANSENGTVPSDEGDLCRETLGGLLLHGASGLV